MTAKLVRTHRAAETVNLATGTEVVLSGWVSRRRDLGNLIFVDLRDRSGIIQLVFDAQKGTTLESMVKGDQLRSEFVFSARGTLVERDEKAINPKLETGRLEVVVSEIEILNSSKNPPFYIQDGVEVDEVVRLKHRYLDLRRPEMQNMLVLRHRVNQALRSYLSGEGFVEVETPMLTRSTPEGARDYLVPSRLQEGAFYALPQSPQLFKQLLMVSGLERYFQFARCFRDEDLRADRQPEFTQLDIEQSFIPLPVFQSMMEEMIAHVFKQVIDRDIPRPFQRLTYQEAMNKYGSDKPDLRYDMPIIELSDTVRGIEFQVFTQALEAGGVVRALVAQGCATYSRKQVDELAKMVAPYGLKGLATIAIGEDGVKSSISKFLTESQMSAIVAQTEATSGDLILIAAAPLATVRQAMGALRIKLAEQLGLADADAFKFLWVVDFPLLSYDEEEGRYVAEHHPFTSPKQEDIDKLTTDPASVRAEAYDLVLNGFEIGGGSMRIYQRALQEQMFKALGFTLDEAYKQFGFLLDAFEYGTPPHGGIAFGMDRLIMIMGKGKSLRDCIAFPKTSSGTDLMTVAPSTVSEAQLDTLHLSIQKSAKPEKSSV